MKRVVLFFSFALLLIGLSGCGFGSNDPQEVTVEFINAFFAQSKDGKPTAEERYEKLLSIVDDKENKVLPGTKVKIMDQLKKAEKEGMTGVYFIAENPAEPQTESYSNQWVKLPKSSFPTAKRGGEESMTLNVTLQRIDGDWKIVDVDLAKGDTDKKIDWVEVQPYK